MNVTCPDNLNIALPQLLNLILAGFSTVEKFTNEVIVVFIFTLLQDLYCRGSDLSSAKIMKTTFYKLRYIQGFHVQNDVIS